MLSQKAQKAGYAAAGAPSALERHAPWLVLITFLALTYLLWLSAHHTSLQEQRIEFEFQARDASERIRRSINHYEQVLYGMRAFYLNQHDMERKEFDGYVASLELEENFSGVQGISFSQIVSDAQAGAHVRAMRRSGLPDYAIRPEGRRAQYAPVTMIAPPNERNRRVLGFDNLANVARRQTIETARDLDSAQLSEKLMLLQEDQVSPQAGVLMFLPVYRRGSVHETLAARRAEIEGWFAAAFRMDDMMHHALPVHPAGLEIAAFDGTVPSEETRLYGVTPPVTSRFHTELPIEIAGRIWTVQVYSLPAFEDKRDVSGELTAAISGVLLSLLLALLTWLLMRDRLRAAHATAAIARELDMRRLAEHRTSELHALNEAILEKSPAGIALFLASGPCVMANEAYARTVGGTVDEVLKQDFRINASWKRNRLLEYAEQALQTGMTMRRDIEGETSFGRQVVVEGIFAPLTVSGTSHLLLIIHDVSERVEARRALTESMRQLEDKELAKTRFLAAAGHDLRQPVAAANLFIDALKLTEPTSRQEAIIQRLDQSMATFNGLLEALLNVSRLDAGMIVPEIGPVNVAELFNWLEHNFAATAQEKKLAFRLYFPMREMFVVRSDIGLLKSVLMNLVSNAIRFTPQGSILVSARPRGDRVLFQVWDSGVGIAPEHITRVFDEFYQVDNPQRDRSNGLGLGLSIVKRALALLSTEIRCRSQRGKGTVFEFSLPLDAQGSEPLRAATTSEADALDESFARGKRFIVVEDDALVAQALLNWLEGMGGEVKCFHKAEDALHHVNVDYADYYIADYMLGGSLNGIQFLNLLRQKLGRPIRAVLVTGDTSSTFIRHAVDCDWPVLHKPINTSKLVSHFSTQVPH